MYAVIALAIALAACGTEYSPPPTFTDIYTATFPEHAKGQCNHCHSLPPNDKSNGMLSMGQDRMTAYVALMAGVSSSSRCGGMTLVVPFDPDASLFVQKFSPNPPCGDRMPFGEPPLEAAQLERIRLWIEDGAPNN